MAVKSLQVNSISLSLLNDGEWLRFNSWSTIPHRA